MDDAAFGVTLLAVALCMSGVLLMVADVFIDRHSERARRRIAAEAADRRQAAREMAALVERARLYDLPLVVEPTRQMHGVIVYPAGKSVVLDERGVPK